MKAVQAKEGKFFINGKGTKLISGSMHYFRIFPEYWEDRLLKIKEAGCNCVETYTCWNLHEKRENEFDFSGMLDLEKFIRLTQKYGLYCIVRPGPYICSEWDMGGLPWWLLKYEDICLRSADPVYMQKCERYLQKIVDIIKPHTIANGGNIIFVQVENEYGSYGSDKKYLNALKEFYLKNDLGCELITADGGASRFLNNGTVEGVAVSVNDHDPAKFKDVLISRGQVPAVMELWNGRAQHWGVEFVRRDLGEVENFVQRSVDEMELTNIYMFCGGTNFGFMNGSIYVKGQMEVQMTSYDVDAPVNEYGMRTEKYYMEQRLFCEKLGLTIQNEAKDVVLREYGEATFKGEICLDECETELFDKHFSSNIRSMEKFDQGYGYIVYKTREYISTPTTTILMPPVRDIAHVYINGKRIAIVYRDKEKEREISFSALNQWVDISILVENMGRVNYGKELKDPKGLLGDVVLEPCTIPANYEIYSLPLDRLPKRICGKAKAGKPAFYEFEIEVDVVADTVLYPYGFTRGVVFCNGFNLGRHWDIENSENKLYVPKPVLRKGKNLIVVFDVDHKDCEKKIRLSGKTNVR